MNSGRRNVCDPPNSFSSSGRVSGSSIAYGTSFHTARSGVGSFSPTTKVAITP
jgi:hypothetical protein